MDNFSHMNPLGSLRAALQLDLSEVRNPPHPCRPSALFLPEGSTAMGRFYGSIGLADQQAFMAALGSLVTDNALKIILDLGAASLTRSAVGTLVAFAADVYGRNKSLYLFRPAEKTRFILDELGISPFFSFLDTEDDVVATLAS